MREERSYAQGWEINPYTGTKLRVHRFEKKYDNQSIVDNLIDLPDGCYPELLIWDLEYGICGQEDKVYIETKYGKKLVRGA